MFPKSPKVKIYFEFCFYRFWSRVPKELINQLEEDSAYGHDLKMFDYSVKKYLKEIGL